MNNEDMFENNYVINNTLVTLMEVDKEKRGGCCFAVLGLDTIQRNRLKQYIDSISLEDKYQIHMNGVIMMCDFDNWLDFLSTMGLVDKRLSDIAHLEKCLEVSTTK